MKREKVVLRSSLKSWYFNTSVWPGRDVRIEIRKAEHCWSIVWIRRWSARDLERIKTRYFSFMTFYFIFKSIKRYPIAGAGAPSLVTHLNHSGHNYDRVDNIQTSHDDQMLILISYKFVSLRNWIWQAKLFVLVIRFLEQFDGFHCANDAKCQRVISINQSINEIILENTFDKWLFVHNTWTVTTISHFWM